MKPNLYPTVEPSPADTKDQTFRLTRISELDAYLRKEVEDRRKMQKKYRRAANISQGVAAGAGTVGICMGTPGLTLVTTGVGALPGVVLGALGAGAFIVNLACGLVTRKCVAKVNKHASIEILARSKLNSIHQLISQALIDSTISVEEFKFISDEVDRYQAMKEDIRSEARKSSDDEAAKKDWIEMRARLAKLENTLGSR